MATFFLCGNFCKTENKDLELAVEMKKKEETAESNLNRGRHILATGNSKRVLGRGRSKVFVKIEKSSGKELYKNLTDQSLLSDYSDYVSEDENISVRKVNQDSIHVSNSVNMSRALNVSTGIGDNHMNNINTCINNTCINNITSSAPTLKSGKLTQPDKTDNNLVIESEDSEGSGLVSSSNLNNSYEDESEVDNEESNQSQSDAEYYCESVTKLIFRIPKTNWREMRRVKRIRRRLEQFYLEQENLRRSYLEIFHNNMNKFANTNSFINNNPTQNLNTNFNYSYNKNFVLYFSENNNNNYYSSSQKYQSQVVPIYQGSFVSNNQSSSNLSNLTQFLNSNTNYPNYNMTQTDTNIDSIQHPKHVHRASHSLHSISSMSKNQNPFLSSLEIGHSADSYSCKECESYYKLVIEHNLELKTMKCMFCNNVLNVASLEFYKKKYRTKGDQESNVKLDTEITTLHTLKTPNTSASSQTYKKPIIENKFSLSSNKKDSKERVEQNNNNYSKTYNSISPNNATSLTIINSDPITNPSKSISKKHSMTENILKSNETIEEISKENSLIENEEKLMTDEHQFSLAELFKRKKSGLLSKLEERLSVSKEKTFRRIEDKSEKRKENIMANSIKKHNINVVNVNVNMNGNIDNRRNYNSVGFVPEKNKTKEPPAELLDRLISGKKATLTTKEMKEVNKRLVQKLPENRPKVDKTKVKKEELTKRKENLNSFTKKLKESVIINSNKNSKNNLTSIKK